MTSIIHRSEIEPTSWIETSIFRSDGKEDFRELSQSGNRHAVFLKNEEWGIVHEDEFNATSFPIETIRHLGKFVNEKTGIPETLASIVIAGFGMYALYKLVK